MKGSTWFNWRRGFSINEGAMPNFSFQWEPMKLGCAPFIYLAFTWRGKKIRWHNDPWPEYIQRRRSL